MNDSAVVSQFPLISCHLLLMIIIKLSSAISHKYLHGSHEMRFAREGRGGKGRGGEGRGGEKAHGSSLLSFQMQIAWNGLVVEMIISDVSMSFGSQLSDTKYQFPVAANGQYLINFRISSHLKQKYVWKGHTIFRCPVSIFKTWICKSKTCERVICKSRACKTRTCETSICKTRTCKTWTCKKWICKTRTCKTRTCKTSICKTRTYKTRFG